MRAEVTAELNYCDTVLHSIGGRTLRPKKTSMPPPEPDDGYARISPGTTKRQPAGNPHPHMVPIWIQEKDIPQSSRKNIVIGLTVGRRQI